MIFRKLIITICFLYIPCILSAGAKEVIDLSRLYFFNNEYYNAITELSRYQYLYPGGGLYAESMVLKGKACFKGGNYSMAIQSLSNCYENYADHLQGEESLNLLGYMRLLEGSPLLAYRNFREYQYSYKNGKFTEESSLYVCYALALSNRMEHAVEEIKKYRQEYPHGKYTKDADLLEKQIVDEINRSKKNVYVSVLGSIVIPGFGHFYTGNYKLGFISFFTNALLIYMIYDGYKKENNFQMLFFTLIEIPFYQYSLYGAVRDVYEYNSMDNFHKQVRLGIKRKF